MRVVRDRFALETIEIVISVGNGAAAEFADRRAIAGWSKCVGIAGEVARRGDVNRFSEL